MVIDPGRVALVHDQIEQDGGAERVLAALHGMFPQAPIYAAFWNRRAVPRFSDCEVRTTWMRRLPGIEGAPRLYAALYPIAFYQLDLRAFDLVISSSSYFASGIRTHDDAVHIAYCHSPSNFVWRPQAYLGRGVARAATAPLRAWLKAWDRWAARQPDLFVANGRTVAERIRACYGRKAAVVPPPIDGRWYRSHQDDAFFLYVGRLVSAKRAQLAIEACTRLALPLWVVGDGRAAARLRATAGPTIRFLGRVSDDALAALYARARAVLIPAEEDFGMVALEAQAAGTPVIAYGRGGSGETVIDGVTGIRFEPQTTPALLAAIDRFTRRSWDRDRIQAHAAAFAEHRFRQSFMEVLIGALARAQKIAPLPPILSHAEAGRG